MKNKDLIALLQEFPEDLTVVLVTHDEYWPGKWADIPHVIKTAEMTWGHSTHFDGHAVLQLK